MPRLRSCGVSSLIRSPNSGADIEYYNDFPLDGAQENRVARVRQDIRREFRRRYVFA
jgi:hypothetical protein